MTFLNGYFRSQAISGQQRYATEIGNRLLQRVPSLRELGPLTSSESRYVQWLDLQATLPARARDGLLLSLTARTPILAADQVVTIHDLFPLTHPEWFSATYARLHQRLLRHHLRHARAIVVVSQPVREQVDALVAPNTPVIVAPNAAATLPSEEDVQFEMALPERFLLTVGSIEPRKNLSRLLEAYGQLHDRMRTACPLLVVGASAAAFRRLHLPTDIAGVHIIGRVTDGQLSSLYRHATALVSASLDEGFGLPIVEAAVHMRGEMVLSDIPAYRWVVGEAVHPIYVNPTSVDSIHAGLLKAVQGSDDDNALQYRDLSQRFSWESSAKKVANLVAALV